MKRINRISIWVAALLALAVGAELSWRFRRAGTTPLFFVKSVAEAQELLANGADVNARSDYGCTPLHFVAGRGQVDIVKFLLDQGADVNAADATGETPLHWAARDVWDPDEGDHAIEGPFDPAHKLETARLLVQRGAGMDAKDSSGTTPLSRAARWTTALTQFLLESGADPKARTVDGFTPLHHVDNAEIARLLIKYGANVNARDKWENRTPLRMTLNQEVKDVLLEHGGTE